MGSQREAKGQLTLSHELLALIQWLVEHDAERLKKIIARATDKGLKERISHQTRNANAQALEEAQHSIMDFFALLEVLLAESLHENTVQQALEKNLMPALEHIDSTQCDDATVRSSVAKATSKLQSNEQANPQEVLFQELLKQWKPSKKAMH